MLEAKSRVPNGNLGEDSTWSSASKLSRKVRELALRTHRAVKEQPAFREGPDQEKANLGDLRNQVSRLHQKIHERRLGVLVPWVDALKRQLEAHLANERKEGLR